jgi:DNA (cytosine-5)-methyltransferase 1
MRYASVCDGIGAAHVAWQPLGWECAWTSEIEPFPAAVVDHHWRFNNLGDMTQLTEEMLQNAGNIQLLVGGTPCQSFSVAGLRGGLADPRGNLALRFVQLVGVLRPNWVVWENVPGVLSSEGGRDFATFLGALAELRYGFAYRVLDAQWFGVAQRRRRVFVVGHLGDWRRAAAVLFERESLRGNPPTRGAKEQEIAVSPSLRAQSNSSHRDDTQAFVPAISPALKARDCKGPSSDGDGDGDGATLVPIVFKENMSTPSWAWDQSETLQAANGCAVAFDTYNHTCGDVSQTLQRGTGTDQIGAAAIGMAVRRLTPKECERLQGFPDGYTDVTYRGKPAADGPRYKALGNSMAVPVMAWIGKRIQMVEEANHGR